MQTFKFHPPVIEYSTVNTFNQFLQMINPESDEVVNVYTENEQLFHWPKEKLAQKLQEMTGITVIVVDEFTIRITE